MSLIFLSAAHDGFIGFKYNWNCFIVGLLKCWCGEIVTYYFSCSYRGGLKRSRDCLCPILWAFDF